MNRKQKCYRCGVKGHKSHQCALPERLCSSCQLSGHERKDCNLLARLESKLLLKILGYLGPSDLLEIRGVCKLVNDIVPKLPFYGDILERRAERILRTKVLPGEPFFSKFKTEAGIHLLISKLARKVPSTSIGRTNIFMFKPCKPSRPPLSPDQYLATFPTTTAEDYDFYVNSVYPASLEQEKYDTKMELKALKLVFKVQCIKYQIIEHVSFNEIMDRKRYDVILKDHRYIRRVNTEVHHCWNMKYNRA